MRHFHLLSFEKFFICQLFWHLSMLSVGITEAFSFIYFPPLFFISWDAHLACNTPHAPPALCMWLEHRPQCSTSSNRQMGVSHSIAMMERNYPAEYCPPTHATSNSLDAQYSPNHYFSAHDCLFYRSRRLHAQKCAEQWLRFCMTKLFGGML